MKTMLREVLSQWNVGVRWGAPVAFLATSSMVLAQLPPAGASCIASAQNRSTLLTTSGDYVLENLPCSGIAPFGVESQGAVKNKLGPTVWELESTLNAYLQLDVVFPAGSMTLVKRTWELKKCTSGGCTVDAKVLIR